MIAIVVLLALCVIAAIYSMGIYKGLASRRENIENAWTNVDILLKQRQDELPKLVACARRYMHFEDETFEKILRVSASIGHASAAANIAAVGAGERQLRVGMNRLLAVAEGYPQLQADEDFSRLQTRMNALEESIADRSERYNEQVNLNNIRIDALPDSLIAGAFGFKPAQLLECAGNETQNLDGVALFRA